MPTVLVLSPSRYISSRFALPLLVSASLFAGQAVASTPPCTLNSTQPSVTICTPAANATVSSPVHVVAASNSSPAATFLQIYLDGGKVYQVAGTQLDTHVTAGAGTHRLTVQAYNGTYFKSTIYITVSSVKVTVQPSTATIVPGA